MQKLLKTRYKRSKWVGYANFLAFLRFCCSKSKQKFIFSLFSSNLSFSRIQKRYVPYALPPILSPLSDMLSARTLHDISPLYDETRKGNFVKNFKLRHSSKLQAKIYAAFLTPVSKSRVKQGHLVKGEDTEAFSSPLWSRNCTSKTVGARPNLRPQLK
jgi:hypothetical protein